MIRLKLFAIVLLVVPFLAAAVDKPAPSVIYDIRDFGAKGDGTTVNTKAVQIAIDKCTSTGGVVLVAGGQFVTGTIFLKSNVCLRVEAGAVLLGSPHIADYSTNTDRTMYAEPYMNRCLIFARDAQNIAFEGNGIIDGQGKSFPEKDDADKNRPKMIRFIGCSHIRMRDLTLKSPASWTSEWRNCTDMAVDGITISSRNISNGDGLDFDGCVNVRVSNSTFFTGDDCLCLQTSDKAHPCLNFTVTNCNFSGRWAGIRIGLLSRANFQNIVVSNCTFNEHNDSGLKIQMMEGAVMSNMLFTNLVMKNVPRPVFLTFNKQNASFDAHGDPPPMNRVHDIVFSNISVEDSIGGKSCGFIVTGMPDHPVENITFSNIHALLPGGGTAEEAKDVLAEFTLENLKGRWPEVGGLRATVPAFGVYLRHVKGVTLRDIVIETAKPDGRPAVVAVDVTGLKISEAPEPDKRP
jgi:polygalacturonase